MAHPALGPIAGYGLIGDTRTAALVSRTGSIDWLCFPRFDSPPMFGRLVGGDRGGSFAVSPCDLVSSSRRYLPGSAVLETTWTTTTGEATLTDAMVADVSTRLMPQGLVVRDLRCRAGTIRARVRFDPRWDWGASQSRAERRHDRLVCTSGSVIATLAAVPDLPVEPGRTHDVQLRAGERLVLALGLDHREPAVLVDPSTAVRNLHLTEAWWRAWSGRFEPPAAGVDEPVRRSLITLRLLTYAPSGAPVAAPTTSLPDALRDPGTWDYRYAWIRDASMGVSAFLACGSTDEPKAFLWWLLHAGRLTRPRLHVLYDVLGRPDAPERTRPELPGYRGGSPVRVGNAAVEQFQLDAHAWMIDAGHAFLRATGDLYAETWRAIQGHADLLAQRWVEPDHGIWELRDGSRHHVHSKVMAWVGLDRALAIAGSRRVRGRRRARWLRARERIAREVRRLGFDEALGAYTQAYGSRTLDAALLALPVSGMEPPDSPRVRRTVDAIAERLGARGPLLFRLSGEPTTAFLPCSFWWSRALAAMGRVEHAREVFEGTCAFASDLGLFAERIEPSTGEHLGNFPQAFTHAALVEAAAELGRVEALRGRGKLRGSIRT